MKIINLIMIKTFTVAFLLFLTGSSAVYIHASAVNDWKWGEEIAPSRRIVQQYGQKVEQKGITRLCLEDDYREGGSSSALRDDTGEDSKPEKKHAKK